MAARTRLNITLLCTLPVLFSAKYTWRQVPTELHFVCIHHYSHYHSECHKSSAVERLITKLDNRELYEHLSTGYHFRLQRTTLITTTWGNKYKRFCVTCGTLIRGTAVLTSGAEKNQAHIAYLLTLSSARYEVIRGSADKSLALPGRKQATTNTLGIYSTYSPRSSIHFLARGSNFCKPLKRIKKSVRPTRSPRRTKNGELSIIFFSPGNMR